MMKKIWQRYIKAILFAIVFVILAKLMVMLFDPDTQTGFHWRGIRFMAKYGFILLPIAVLIDLIGDFIRNRRGN
jgi:hypothetical protein